MSSSPKEIYILGAGFTKAFADSAPLLIDHYDTHEVRNFDAFPYTHAILEQERNRRKDGKINLERLMTRLAGGMPYDWMSGEQDLLRGLLSTLKRSLLEKLGRAKTAANVHWDDLKRFATHCRDKHIHCITFNYDDFLDTALFQTRDPSLLNSPSLDWHPNWGYGFFCNSSAAAVGIPQGVEQRASPHRDADQRPLMSMSLIKLHGSVNWRIRHGHPTPHAADAITHFEDWWTIPQYGGDLEKHRTFLIPLVDPYLDPEPFIVPPVLTKSDLVEQPVLRVLWSRAFKLLKDATKVTFVGYSLPVTDIAAATLFCESLADLKFTDVTVVDYAAEADRAEQCCKVRKSYSEVFPGITDNQIDLRGGLAWAQAVCRG
jgi:hypothetical protein